jgi:hypothetical protein
VELAGLLSIPAFLGLLRQVGYVSVLEVVESIRGAMPDPLA